MTASPPPPPARPETRFAPAERAAPERLLEAVAYCRESPLTAFLLQSLGGLVAILNEERQILAASPGLAEALGPRWGGPEAGTRPGEAFGCIHVAEGPGGCGTALACAHCGLVLALLAALEGEGPHVAECHLSLRRQGRWEAAEFRVSASRLELEGHRFLGLVFQDIGAEKHRETLERLFFHDFANLLQGLHGWSECLSDGTVRVEEAARRILHLSERLGQEVHSHRRLLQAERGRLSVEPKVLQGRLVLQELHALLERHPAASGRRIELAPAPGPETFVSDPDLLLRVLYNMALNALEATRPSETVRVAFDWRGERPRFSVHNPGCIPETVRPRIFHRTFSTKAPKGRGLGTHAMKLFGENLLQGRVDFRSTPEEGTTFWIQLPPRLGAPRAPRAEP